MPKIIAYVMLSDPEWLVPSISSYYNICDQIIAIHDDRYLGHSGHKIDVGECLERMLGVDTDSKIQISKGNFTRFDNPHDNESDQRSTGIKLASESGADWILHIDTDEIVPDEAWLYEKLSSPIPKDRHSVEIAGRVVYGFDGNKLLQVSSLEGTPEYFEHIPIAVRPFTELKRARYADNQLIFHPNTMKREIIKQYFKRVIGKKYFQLRDIEPDKCIIHMSWARSKLGIRNKVDSWAHLNDFNVESYLVNYWNKAQEGGWQELRNLHPIWPEMWRRLKPKPVEDLKLNKKLESLVYDELKYLNSRI